jgi:molybdopterin molybdotransferase
VTDALIDIATARERVLSAVTPLAAEPVELAAALGRVVAEDLASAHDLPPFDSSAMDGYAVVAGPAAELDVVGESRAGHPAERGLATGEAIAISTGAQIPEGADAVVPVERVEVQDGRVRVPETPPGNHVRRAGEDVRAGTVVVRAGSILGPAELAVAASVGRDTLLCGRQPRVAVLVTGDELVGPGVPLGPGQIRDSNTTALGAQAERAGAEVVSREVVPDDRDATAAALGAALDRADVICVSGGVSVGPHDHVKPALHSLGVEERFWGVALKPGKPTWFGTRGKTLVFGLPGNPVSAMVTFHLFVRPALRALAGGNPEDTRTTGVLDEAVGRNPVRDQVLRCVLSARDDGWHVQPTKAQESHVLTSMVGAGAYALVVAGEGAVPAGERVPIELVF